MAQTRQIFLAAQGAPRNNEAGYPSAYTAKDIGMASVPFLLFVLTIALIRLVLPKKWWNIFRYLVMAYAGLLIVAGLVNLLVLETSGNPLHPTYLMGWGFMFTALGLSLVAAKSYAVVWQRTVFTAKIAASVGVLGFGAGGTYSGIHNSNPSLFGAGVALLFLFVYLYRMWWRD